MRSADLARLNESYPEALEPSDRDARAAIGAELPKWDALVDEILQDFVEAEPYGVHWWATNPSTSRRILIADQLASCLEGVRINHTEASLHWLEYLDATDRQNALLAYAVKPSPRGLVIDWPKPRCPAEQLVPNLVRMHQAGLVRATASALDCLAAVVIGVVALPTSILKADFKDVRKVLSRKMVGADSPAEKVQAEFAKQMEDAITAVGPAGWLDWTLDLRNMLVHRGRRIELSQFLPRQPVLLGPDGMPARGWCQVSHLPLDPGRSDVEVFIETPWKTVLQEDAKSTLRGIASSTGRLLEAASEHLLNLWRWRRENPTELPQPIEQWRDLRSIRSMDFNGYEPGSLPLEPSLANLSPVLARRLQAAALDDSNRHKWPTFE